MGEWESPDFGLRATLQRRAPSRFALEPHCFAGGETCELFNALLKPLDSEARKNPKLAPNRTVLFRLPACRPKNPTLRRGSAKLCANFAYILFGSVKGSRPPLTSATRRAKRKDSSAPTPSGRLLDLLKIKFAWFHGDPWPIMRCVFGEAKESWLIFVSRVITCRIG